MSENDKKPKETKCRKCGHTYEVLLAMAILGDAVANKIPHPEKCCDGGDHDFDYAENK